MTFAHLVAGLQPFPWDGSRADQPVAVDATDRLLLDTAAPLIEAIVGAHPAAGAVAVLDDRFGALTLAAVALGARDVRVFQDSRTAEDALDANAAALNLSGTYTRCAPGPDLFAGARVVLAQLPKSLAAVRDYAESIARHAPTEVTVLAGGRIKHMSHAMNDVLADSFGEVHAGRARGKSRVLTCTSPRADLTDRAPTYPARAVLADPVLSAPVEVFSHGQVFAGTRLDHGTRFLLTFADRFPAGARQVVDLGCGSGILAVEAARRLPDAQVVATDVSAAAVWSATATAHAAGLAQRVTVVRGDAAAGLPSGCADLVLLNPPFHAGTAVSTHTADGLFAAAGRLLRPGGQLWCVWNSHLRYRPALTRAVGPTAEAGRDPRFTVTVSTRR